MFFPSGSWMSWRYGGEREFSIMCVFLRPLRPPRPAERAISIFSAKRLSNIFPRSIFLRVAHLPRFSGGLLLKWKYFLCLLAPQPLIPLRSPYRPYNREKWFYFLILMELSPFSYLYYVWMGNHFDQFCYVYCLHGDFYTFIVKRKMRAH